MFGFIKSTIQSLYKNIRSKTARLFGLEKIDQSILDELETILIEADTGVSTSKKIIQSLKDDVYQGTLQTGQDLKSALEHKMLDLMQNKQFSPHAQIYILVGVNGSGKTTFAAKLGNLFLSQGKSIMFAAADTFRAAAVEQLTVWAERLNAPIVVGKQNQDPASVVYAACEQFVTSGRDILIIDTAGRLQTKVNLMKELQKIRSMIDKKAPDKAVCTLLTVDSMLGQNSFMQAKLFNESCTVNGIVLTKMDGTGKGGVVFGISHELHLPIAYVSYGESIEQCAPFDAKAFVNDIFEN